MLVTTASKRASRRSNPDPVVLIRSSAYASLPAPGNRVGTGDASNMPTIQASTGNSAIKTATGAHHYRLVGLNVEAPTTALAIAAVTVGGRNETLLSQFPTDITIDRCIVKGDTTVASRRGVLLDGIRCAVVDSYIYDFKDTSDAQAIWAYNTPGPIKIVNNYLEGTGENVMIGGTAPSYGVNPSDIEIRRNYFKKQSAAAWAASWSIKNLLEFKQAKRVLVEGNVLDTNYLDSQSGMSILITPRSEAGAFPDGETSDITIRWNLMKNVEGGINISGRDDVSPSQVTNRVSIYQNLFELKDLGRGGDLRCHQIINGPVDVQIINNTWVFDPTWVAGVNNGTCGFHDNTPDASNTIWRNNVFAAGNYGISGTGTGEGTETFDAFFAGGSGYTYSYNVMYGSVNGQPNYPTANNQFPSAATDVFTNFASGDYTVKAAYQGDGSDSLDPGVNISTLNTMKANSEDGQWGSEPATYTDRTYTNAELPRSYVDTTYANQTGTEWVCTTAAEFTTALAGCSVGDIITLTAGNTFTGSFTLRNI